MLDCVTGFVFARLFPIDEQGAGQLCEALVVLADKVRSSRIDQALLVALRRCILERQSSEFIWQAVRALLEASTTYSSSGDPVHRHAATGSRTSPSDTHSQHRSSSRLAVSTRSSSSCAAHYITTVRQARGRYTYGSSVMTASQIQDEVFEEVRY